MENTTLVAPAWDEQTTEQLFFAARAAHVIAPDEVFSDWIDERALLLVCLKAFDIQMANEQINKMLYSCGCGGCFTCVDENHPEAVRIHKGR